ncbi:ketopantoate reductase family protein [Myroides odoratus]|uniref:2-dehydropantoate 2-reductase n=1 Tax=Myroides odoratus TaxID=256 RepID=A0A9Q7E7J1_MYROD|nr:2-dehydropantoate 2-reductase [Myroides odoratus]EHQ42170.1 ketopantoate reductase [Myroides odoratus DSM 2801]EKB09336.1 2-dehydropantoate 2-reductase [Myroides odoratus CIP 103059]QQT99550.1 2-dehydropantoate 2-reductase [Myroides odoratus]WQD58242.1 2-dehydropantoate 2-reductase [Myroides odoratus]STZ29430.1 2-dehydropantoate 2-reductase [Myroides odoratus]
MSKINIGVIGLGGVGGFYGGLLAHHFEQDAQVDIHFVARGEHGKQIETHGLTVLSKGNVIIGKPAQVVERVQELGAMDFILLCTKEYDLDKVIDDLKAIVSKNTVILPLLNGVEAFEKLDHLLDAEVWQGCTYMVSRLKEAGVIDNPSGRQKIVFGRTEGITPQMLQLDELLKAAGIISICTQDIAREVWEKYILVSSSAVATAFYNCSFGVVMRDHPAVIQALVTEASQVAQAKGVNLTEDVVEVVMQRLAVIPFDSTTSMHSDFLSNKPQTELEVMAGYLIREGLRLQTDVQTYQKLYDVLKVKQGHYTM